MSNLFYKAIITGIIFVIIGLLLAIIFNFLKPKLPKECETWDKYYIMEVTLFFNGVIFRYLLQNENIRKYII